jgi:hypothetical protein
LRFTHLQKSRIREAGVFDCLTSVSAIVWIAWFSRRLLPRFRRWWHVCPEEARMARAQDRSPETRCAMAEKIC